MKTKKLPYDNAELEVVAFSGEDVIATSGTWNPWEDLWDNVDPDGGDWA